MVKICVEHGLSPRCYWLRQRAKRLGRTCLPSHDRGTGQSDESGKRHAELRLYNSCAIRDMLSASLQLLEPIALDTDRPRVKMRSCIPVVAALVVQARAAVKGFDISHYQSSVDFDAA